MLAYDALTNAIGIQAAIPSLSPATACGRHRRQDVSVDLSGDSQNGPPG